MACSPRVRLPRLRVTRPHSDTHEQQGCNCATRGLLIAVGGVHLDEGRDCGEIILVLHGAVFLIEGQYGESQALAALANPARTKGALHVEVDEAAHRCGTKRIQQRLSCENM
eukprot:5395163-Amphidinium_carterae.1